jgi:hypothetical protein
MSHPRNALNGRPLKTMKTGNANHCRLCRRLIFLLLILLAAPLLACGGSGGGDTDSSNTANTTGAASGTFLDAAVSGLRYQTPTHSGVTDANGTFTYTPGETVTFSMGYVMLGQGTAQSTMTPVDLVPRATDESDPAVTNMARMLQTADNDGDPSNGIMITSDVSDLMDGMDISFDMSPDDFDMQPDVQQFMSALQMMGADYSGRTMVSAMDAQDHMRNTLMEMDHMMGASSSGLNTGRFVDSAVEGIYYQTATQSGFTDAQGTYTYMDGETIRFSMGDVVLGEALAQSVMTPMTLVPGAQDETDPAVTNMARLLQTMDYDNDPSNGIMIPDAVETEMFDRHIDFDMTPEAFAQDPDVTMLMDDLADMDPAYAGRMIVSAEDAQAHMGQTLADMGMSADGSSQNGTDDGSMTGTGGGSMTTGDTGTMTGSGGGSMTTGDMF